MSLKVYKSSAGSGKTTTLVNEYLKLALSKENNFKNILAITFTNKAANEMKERVINDLRALANCNEVPKKLIPVFEYLNTDINDIKQKANKLHSLIIHNYDEFAISTIDAFIHKIIRTFATDVELPQNFEVVIDDADIIPDIVNMLYDKVGKDPSLTRLLIDFVMSETNDEKGYDPTSRLTDFIELHMREDGFYELNKLNDLTLDELSDIIKIINSKSAKHFSEARNYAKQAIDLCNSIQLETADFLNGARGGYLSYMSKLQEYKQPDKDMFASNTLKNNVEQQIWYKKTLHQGKKDLIDSVGNDLQSHFNRSQENLESCYYYTLVLNKIFSLALVNEIRKLFADYTNDTGKVHISEFNKKISRQIAGEPVPFIYERLGRKYRYFLIDEFQDTSLLQWNNLLPLINESLSHGHFNMLVGDAKQAIYRFRNGEVDLFVNLPRLYKNDGSSLSIENELNLVRNYEPAILNTNWRSYHDVVSFNNGFFSYLKSSISERNQLIYSDISQDVPANKKEGGLVSINLIYDQYEESLKHQRIKKVIVEVLLKGYKPEEICILCRTKKMVISIASYLIENNIDVVSGESLLLTNSSAVRLIISFLKLMYNPLNDIAKVEFLVNYKTTVNPDMDIYQELEKIKEEDPSSINLILNRYINGVDKSVINSLSVFEVAEFLIREIIKSKSPDIFLQFFLDYALENNLDIGSFIRIWEIKQDKLFISLPENLQAVRLMTIHKAKGLEFPIVIVDAENKSSKKTKNEYWEEANIPGAEKLQTVLLPLNQNLEKINRSDIYEEEQSKNELDYVNLLYVAFTRAVAGLFIIGEVSDDNTKDKISNYLISYLKDKHLWKENEFIYEFGQLPEPNQGQAENKVIELDNIINSDWTKLISVVNDREVSMSEIIESKSSREYGNLIHRILSEIYTIKDVKKVIERLNNSGLFTDSELQIIEDIMYKVVGQAELSRYFDCERKMTVKNESEILLKSGEIIRPDKVIVEDDLLTIVDYKTGESKQADRDQMNKYANSLEELGYKSVKALLVYIDGEISIEKVKD